MKPKAEESDRETGICGFTLVEVMITLTILGFILLMIFGVFRLGLSAWEKGEKFKEDDQRLRAVSQLLSRQIKSIFPYKIRTSKAEGDYLAFEGGPRSVKFVSALPLSGGPPQGLVYVIYDWKKNGKDGGSLVLYEQRVLNKDFMSETPREESGVPFLEGLAEVRFEYYREEDAPNKKAAEWVEEWKAREEGELPKALRITLVPLKKATNERGTPQTFLTSVPAYRYEEIRTGLIRRAASSSFAQ